MKLEVMSLQENNKVMQVYTNDKEFLHTFFDYKNEQSSFSQRLNELNGRTYKRSQLAAIIRSFMEPFGITEKAEKHICELAENAVTVVGGQQAGLLTGPLYSVHKAITVILLAKKQREILGVPVVPVFWVAGEDHDLNEINHVYTSVNGRNVKNQYREKFVLKHMASDAVYDKMQMSSFIKETFAKFGETGYTRSLLDEVLLAVDEEATFTHFFVRLMNGLFGDEGLLFIDSAFKPLRELESDYFVQFIQESEQLAKSIYSKEAAFSQLGLGHPMGVEKDAANLFYIHETGRVLLTRKDGYFVNESFGIRFTKDELLQIAEKEPWLLSNNVATRPIMQDKVFPVLSFVGGPGEIAYWSLLKDAFHTLDIQMPIITPRMSMTLVTTQVRHALEEQKFSVECVMAGDVFTAREQFVEGLRDEQFNIVLNETKEMLTAQYEKIAVIVNEKGNGLQNVLQKNLQLHSKQIEYLREKSEDLILLQQDKKLRKFGLIESELYPDGSLQERVYTPYMYLNSYGPSLIQDLLALPFEIDGTHKVVYL